MDMSRKKDKILNALIEHKGLQSITEIGEEVLGNPLFVYDISGKILAKSSSEEAVGVWKNLIPDDHLDADRLHLAEQDGAIDRMLSNDDPVIAKFPFSPYRVMGCRIRDKDSAVGISTVVEVHELKEEDKELLVMISKTILFELLYRERTAMQTIPYYSLLKDIIEETAGERSIRERCNVLKLKIPEDMILLGIKFSDKRENSLSLFYIRETMMTILPSSLCIIYDKSLLIIVNKKHFRKDLIDQIRYAFSNYEMRIGITAAYYQPEKVGNTVVLIGGGLIGCEVALHLAALGKDVTILEVTDTLARDANMFHRPTMMENMEAEKEKIHHVLNASTKVIGTEGVLYTDVNGKEQFVYADTVLYAVGSIANTEVVEELRKWDEWDTFMPIGDCTGASIIRKAVHGGYFAAMDIGC